MEPELVGCLIQGNREIGDTPADELLDVFIMWYQQVPQRDKARSPAIQLSMDFCKH